MISLIAAVDEDFGLGKDNALLCHLPADLQYFKAITMGKPIIMGRKTFDSIGKALPGRMNIVISHHQFVFESVCVVTSLDEALELVKSSPEVVVIGGGSMYKQAIQYASRIYLTQIHAKFDADVFFPIIDPSIWACSERVDRPRDANNDYDLTFYQYQRGVLK